MRRIVYKRVMEETKNCCVCQGRARGLTCVRCSGAVCKNCAHFISADDFLLAVACGETVPDGTFCHGCFLAEVDSALLAYQAAVKAAEDVFVYYRTEAKESYFIRRTERPLKTTETDDRTKAMLQLAYLTAKAGYNCLVDVQLNSKKKITQGYQKSFWSAIGIPAQVDPVQIQNRSRPN